MEQARIAELKSYDLNRSPEPTFDLLVEVAANLLQVPFAFISIIDEEDVWTKAAYGTELTVTKKEKDICTYTILQEEVLEIQDLKNHHLSQNLPIAHDGSPYKCYLGANLKTKNGFMIGTLCILDSGHKSFSQQQKKILQGLADQVMVNLELKKVNQKLEKIAYQDHLTNVLSRGGFFLELDKELQSAAIGTDLALFFFDLDHFKKINDTYGHPTGDAVLQKFGKVLSRGCSSKGIVGRVGGEEFCFFAKISEPEAYEIAENLRMELSREVFEESGKRFQVTSSIGIAIAQKSQDLMAGDLIKKADLGVYQAKEKGRNCSVVIH